MKGDATNLQSVIDVAQLAVAPKELDAAKLYAVVDSSGGVGYLDLQQFQPHPRLPDGNPVFHETDSLVRYVAAQDTSNARIYGDKEAAKVVAVMDDNQSAAPGWRIHRATLALQYTTEWKLWGAGDKTMMDQVKFAELIENGLEEIIEPPEADMLEIALNFQASTSVEFRSGTRLTSGQRQLTYIENTAAGGGAEKRIEIPEKFKLQMPIYEDGTAYELTARLRYRIESGHLKIGYFLIRPQDTVRAAFLEEVRKVETGTKVAAVIGIP